jgi:polygalacturonase
MTRTPLLLAGLLAAAACAKSATVCDPKTFGAKADGKTRDTAAVQAAIDKCSGGTVRVTAGTYLIAPITLKNNVTLQLDSGAKLLGTEDPADYRDPAKAGGFVSLVNATRQENIAITGEGVIDGSGAPWWEKARAAKKAGTDLPLRPRLVTFSRCKHIRVEGVTLANSPMFHLVPSMCEDVVIRRVKIDAPRDAPNTDGIDPAASRNVRISECVIDVGDDNIAVKSGTADPDHPNAAAGDITISNCTFLHGHGVSIGSETNGGVKGMRVENCKFIGTENGLRVKSYRGRGGIVSDLIYSDITMENVTAAITITEYYPKIPKTDEALPMKEGTPAFRNIRIANLTATATKSAGVIVGLPESPITGVVLDNVRISAPTGIVVRNATVNTTKTTIEAKKGPAWVLEDKAVVK